MRTATQTAIITALKTAWDADMSLPRFIAENHKGTPVAGTPWARAKLTFGETYPASVGASLERTTVIFHMQVFLPPETGVRAAMDTADALRALFPLGNALSYTNGDKAVTAECMAGPVGPDSAGNRDGWEQQNISMTFKIDEIAAG